jgi:galactokinase
MSPQDRARAAFAERFGAEPDGVVFAPGRVNLIGEHVDYNDGLVLPMPVRQGTAVAWGHGVGGLAEVHAADFDNDDAFAIAGSNPPPEVDWRAYCRGMVALAPAKPADGIRLAIAGNLPRGSGLSSSASLCVALGRALAAAAGDAVDPTALALAAQRTEHEFAGVRCGIMDQMAVAAGEPGHAMLLDCRDLKYRLVALPENWAVLTVDSGVTRGLVDGEYNQRRAQCAEAARLLGVASLRDASIGQLDEARLPDLTDRRARHVISEIARVRAAAQALESGDIAEFAALLREGHASLRDLFEVSVPAVDALVEELQAIVGPGGGVRMTGAGFGGSVVVVAQPQDAVRVVEQSDRPVNQVYGADSG